MEITGEQHWKYTYLTCEPQVRRDPLPRKKRKMPRKRPPKSVWDDEKTMYDLRPEISEEIMEIIKGSERNPRLMPNNSRIKKPYPKKIHKLKPIYSKNHRSKRFQRHYPKLKNEYSLRDKPPPEIHNSFRKSQLRFKRGNPETIMTFTI